MTSDKYNEQLQAFHLEAGGAMEVVWIDGVYEAPRLLFAGQMGDPNANHLIDLISKSLNRIKARKNREPAICGACEHEFKRDRPLAFIVLRRALSPETSHLGMTTPVCERCYRNKTPEQIVKTYLDHTRKIWPDLRMHTAPATEGNA
jgi:hypothetical protein